MNERGWGEVHNAVRGTPLPRNRVPAVVPASVTPSSTSQIIALNYREPSCA